jgi:L-alanine-DL-glutamate epimerase-like enolase superfamily enzyme
MKITDVKAYPTSFPIPKENRVALGIGTAVKRDAVIVKVTTDEGITGSSSSAWTPTIRLESGKRCTASSSPATAWAPARASP